MYSSRIVLNQQQIDAINWRNFQRSDTNLIDLSDTETKIEVEQLKMMFALDKLEQEPRYTKDGICLDDNFYNALKSKICGSMINCELQSDHTVIPIRCAVAIDNTLIRAYPTMMNSYRADEIRELDRFAVSVLKLGEPVHIYCETTDAVWCFVRTAQIRGWVLRDALALEPDLYRWQQYCSSRDQVLVADSRLTLTYVDCDGLEQQQLLLMGTRLVLYDATRKSFLVGLPVKDKRGNLAVQQLMLPRDGAMIPGLIPLSAQNVVSLAKKMLGEPYGWGGTDFYRDCTSLISDVYAVFGLQFPRNCNEQMQMFGVEQCPLNQEEKYYFLKNLMPGSVLYIPGHAMVYLGEQNQKLQMLHSSYAIALPAKEGWIIHKIRRVVEGDLSQYRVDGKTFFDAITAVWSPEQQKQHLKHLI